MKTISVSEAETHFEQILDEVERGETYLITRDGRIFARMSAGPPSGWAAETHTDLSETGS